MPLRYILLIGVLLLLNGGRSSWSAPRASGGSDSPSVSGSPVKAEIRPDQEPIQPLGDAVQVAAAGENPSVAGRGVGDFVVTWETPDPSPRARRFSAAGVPVGNEIIVNQGIWRWAPEPWMKSNGEFVVSYSHEWFVGYDIYVLVEGTKVAADDSLQDFEIAYDFSWGPAHVAGDAGDRFVVVWEGFGKGPRGRRFASDASPLGNAFSVYDVPTPGSPGWDPDVAVAPTGEFMIVWANHDEHYSGIFARLFAADGSASGDPFQVNTITTGGQGDPRISSNSAGDWAVVWESAGSLGGDTDGTSIQLRRFWRSGAPRDATERQVNTEIGGFQLFPCVAYTTSDGTDRGNILILWTASPDGLSPFAGISAQLVSDSGQDIGSEYTVSEETLLSFDYSVPPSLLNVGLTRRHEVAVVWATDTGVVLQRLRLPVFTDGFETGDLWAWTRSQGSTR